MYGRLIELTVDDSVIHGGHLPKCNPLAIEPELDFRGDRLATYAHNLEHKLQFILETGWCGELATCRNSQPYGFAYV